MVPIDKDAVMMKLSVKARANEGTLVGQGYARALDVIREMKPLEVRVVDQGRWLHVENRIHAAYKCSICGVTSTDRTKFCCNCGTRMEND